MNTQNIHSQAKTMPFSQWFFVYSCSWAFMFWLLSQDCFFLFHFVISLPGEAHRRKHTRSEERSIDSTIPRMEGTSWYEYNLVLNCIVVFLFVFSLSLNFFMLFLFPLPCIELSRVFLLRLIHCTLLLHGDITVLSDFSILRIQRNKKKKVSCVLIGKKSHHKKKNNNNSNKNEYACIYTHTYGVQRTRARQSAKYTRIQIRRIRQSKRGHEKEEGEDAKEKKNKHWPSDDSHVRDECV